MKLFLLSVPYDSGHHKKRQGSGTSILLQGLAEQLTSTEHAVRKSELLIKSDFATEITTSFEIHRKVSEYIREAIERNEFPIVFSGNCNTAAIGILSGLPEDTGIIWFDCHGDYNTPETTVGGFLDGMALSIATGECWKQLTASISGFKPVEEDKIVLIGGRDFDPLEEKRLHDSRIKLISPGMVKQFSDTSDTPLIPIKSVYLHIDVDVLDPGYAKVNSYNSPGGLFPEDLCKMIGIIRKKHKISAVAFTSYDPALDPNGKVHDVVNQVTKILTE